MMSGYIYTVEGYYTNMGKAVGLFPSKEAAWKAMYAAAKKLCGRGDEIDVSPEEIVLKCCEPNRGQTTWKLFTTDFNETHMEEKDGHWALVNLILLREEVLEKNRFNDYFSMFIPKDVKDVAAYAENIFRKMAHDILTGAAGYQHIRMSSYDYNWADFAHSITDEVMEKYQCYHGCYGSVQLDNSVTNVLVNHDECLLADKVPCTVTVGIPNEKAARYAAEAYMTNGQISLLSELSAEVKNAPETLWLIFDGKSDADCIPLCKTKLDAERNDEVFWLESEF